MANILHLPLIITRNQVYFPNNQSDDLDANRTFTTNAIKYADETHDKYIIVATQKVFSNNNPEQKDIYEHGVLAKLTKVRPRASHVTVRLEPLFRIVIHEISVENDMLFAEVTELPSFPLPKNVNVSALREGFVKFLSDNLELMRRINIDIQTLSAPDVNLEELIYFVANKTLNSTEQRIAILSELDVVARLELLMKFLENDVNNNSVNDIRQKIRNNTKNEQLSEGDANEFKDYNVSEDPDDEEEFDSGEEILDKLKKSYYPPHIVSRVKKEVRKMGRSEQSERSRIIEYIDWLLKLPYDKETIDNLDLENVEKVLDNDHYGLKDPKSRIVEFIAVKRLSKDNRATVLCFYGPPGTGKTSLAMSIAKAMGRKLVKASLGGVDDESKLRGFLRTYVGAQPGTIVSNMRKVGTINPIFVLDEVDKMGRGSLRGDPSAALLEILDPQQNKAFTDHYIDEPYDLSKVVFIATANSLRDISPPLRDRMELIELKGYTEEEKVQIALRHLIPAGIEEHGLSGYNIKFTEDALRTIIDNYTLEAGVRTLNQQISAILRKIGVEILKDSDLKLEITSEEARRHLGKPKLFFNTKEKEPIVGVVTGLSVLGGSIGEILKIEVTTFKGKGAVNITGNLEKMIKESGDIAATHVRSYASKYGISPDLFLGIDINVHFPEAVTKDGNSAGLAMATGVISALTGRKVNSEVAMTGEITLMGRVLAIGGVHEKLIGAIRAGIKTVLIPKDNERDLDDIPEEVKSKVKIIPVSHIDEALPYSLLPLEEVRAEA